MPDLTYTINERALTDDTITFHADGTVTVTYHTYASPWSDREHVVTFETEDDADRFVVERYGKTWERLFYDMEDEA